MNEHELIEVNQVDPSPPTPMGLLSDATLDIVSSSSTAAAAVISDSTHSSDINSWWQVVLATLGLFILAGLFEIGGGWFYWVYFRSSKPWYYLLIGGVLLLFYGYIPTLQSNALQFGRVYAVYGGIFIILSLLWSWAVDGNKPDRGDVIGSSIAVGGVLVMLYYPR